MNRPDIRPGAAGLTARTDPDQQAAARRAALRRFEFGRDDVDQCLELLAMLDLIPPDRAPQRRLLPLTPSERAKLAKRSKR